MPAWLAIALACGSPLFPPHVASAQGNTALPEAEDLVTETGAPMCNGERIVDILVYAAAPTVAGVRRVPIIGAFARSTHVTTQPQVIRQFLLFEEGGTCTEFARAESERVLRAQPFIADATVGVVRMDGGVRIDVRTIDEASFVFGTRVNSGTPFVRRLRVGNANLGGAGVYLAGEWRDGGPIRNGYALTATDYQLGGKPFVFHLHARRAPLGGELHSTVVRPFLTSLQRHAWRVGGGQAATYTHLQHPDIGTRAIRVEREYADAGAMARIGPPTRLGLLGASLSYEHEAAGADLIAFAPDGTPIPAGTSTAAEPYTSARINWLVGYRALSFVRAAGFDALTATQDIPVGLQAGFVVGRGLNRPSHGGGARELFAAADLYAGGGSADRTTRVQLRTQGARNPETAEWGRVVSTGRLTHQNKLSDTRLLEINAEWSGAWRPGVPFQLMLGAEEGGVRGYEHARTGGARRAVLRVEERRVLGNPFGSLGDIGIATFADVGRVWRGDAPFGVTTPVRTSVGVSLLAAVPSRSARLWRIDVAMPLQGPGRGRVELGFSNADRTSLFWREPNDIGVMRGRTVPASVFAWP